MAFQPIARSVGEYPSRLESPHRPLRSADELVGEAGRFREPIPDGAGKDDLLRGAQVDQVTDTDEDRIDAVLRLQHAADCLSRLHHTAHTLPVYASRHQLPGARATLGSGCWANVAGRE